MAGFDTINYSVPPKIPIRHGGTVSSNGKITTSQPNQEVEMQNGEGDDVVVNALEITNHGADMNVKMTVAGTDESNYHLIESGASKVFADIQITKFVVVDNGSQFSYSGGYY